MSYGEREEAKVTKLEEFLQARVEQLVGDNVLLKRRIDELQMKVDGIPALIANTKEQLLQQMANAAVNCGKSYGCSLAARWKDGE